MASRALLSSNAVPVGLNCPVQGCDTTFASSPAACEPVALIPCWHSVCKACLDALRPENGRLYCPICKTMIEAEICNRALLARPVLASASERILSSNMDIRNKPLNPVAPGPSSSSDPRSPKKKAKTGSSARSTSRRREPVVPLCHTRCGARAHRFCLDCALPLCESCASTHNPESHFVGGLAVAFGVAERDLSHQHKRIGHIATELANFQDTVQTMLNQVEVRFWRRIRGTLKEAFAQMRAAVDQVEGVLDRMFEDGARIQGDEARNCPGLACLQVGVDQFATMADACKRSIASCDVPEMCSTLRLVSAVTTSEALLPVSKDDVGLVSASSAHFFSSEAVRERLVGKIDTRRFNMLDKRFLRRLVSSSVNIAMQLVHDQSDPVAEFVDSCEMQLGAMREAFIQQTGSAGTTAHIQSTKPEPSEVLSPASMAHGEVSGARIATATPLSESLASHHNGESVANADPGCLHGHLRAMHGSPRLSRSNSNLKATAGDTNVQPLVIRAAIDRLQASTSERRMEVWNELMAVMNVAPVRDIPEDICASFLTAVASICQGPGNFEPSNVTAVISLAGTMAANHSLSKDVASAFCELIGTLSRHVFAKSTEQAAAAEMVHKEFVIISLTTLLLAHRHDTDMQVRGCLACIAFASVSDGIRSAIADSNAVSCVFAAMAAHGTATDVQRAGVAVLDAVSCVLSHRAQQLVKDQGVELVTRAMSAHRADEDIQSMALSVLLKLCAYQRPDVGTAAIACEDGFTEHSNLPTVAATLGVPQAKAAMTAHPTVPQIQVRCMRFLNDVARVFPHLCEDALDTTIVTVVGSAMATYGDVVEIQELACTWLVSALKHNRGSVALFHCTLLFVSSALHRFREHVPIQVAGLELLQILSRHPDCLDVLEHNRGLLCIIEGMRAHSTCTDVLRSGCFALNNFCRATDPSFCSLVCQLGGASCMKAALDSSLASLRNDSGTQSTADTITALENVMDTLVHMSGTAEAQQSVRTGVLPTAVSVLMLEPCTQSPALQLAGCEIIRRLCEDPEACVDVLEASGLDCVLNAMDHHVDDPAIQTTGCQVIGSLCESHTGNLPSLLVHSVDVVVKAMERHVRDPGVQLAGLSLLHRMCAVPACSSYLVEGTGNSNGGLHRIVVAMAAHPHLQTVTQLGCDTLFRVSQTTDHHTCLLAEGRGVLPAVLAAATHPEASTDAELQLTVCAFLERLCGNERDDVRKSLVNGLCQGVDSLFLLTTLSKASPRNLRICLKLLTMVCNATTNSENTAFNPAKSRLQSGLSKVVSALLSVNDVGAAQTGCCLLSAMAERAEYHSAFVKVNAVTWIATLLEMYPDTVGVAEACCQTIYSLYKSSHRQLLTSQSPPDKEAVISALISCVWRHRRVSSALLPALCALQHLFPRFMPASSSGNSGSPHASTPVSSVSQPIAELVINRVLGVVSGASSEPDIHREAYRLLQAVCYSVSGHQYFQTFIAKQGISVVCDGMVRFVNDAQVIKAGCDLISNTLRKVPSEGLPAESECKVLINAICRVERANPDCPAVRNDCCILLCTVSTKVPKMAASIGKADGLAMILEFLHRNCVGGSGAPGNPQFLASGWHALARLCAHEPNYSKFLTPGVIDQLLVSARQIAGDIYCKRQACFVFSRLAACCASSGQTVACDEKVLQAGGEVWSFLQSAMSSLPDDLEVQVSCCSFIRSVMLREWVNDARLSLVLTALDRHGSDKAVQRDAFSILKYAVEQTSTSDQGMMASLLAVDGLWDCVINWLARPGVSAAGVVEDSEAPLGVPARVTSAISILCTLASNSRNHSRIVELGALARLCSTMMLHPEAPFLQAAGCAIIRALCGNPDVRGVVVDHNAVDVVAFAMHCESTRRVAFVHTSGCVAIQSLVVDPHILPRVGSLKSVLAALRDAIGSDDRPMSTTICESGCTALAVLCQSSLGMEAVIGAGLLTNLLTAMDRHDNSNSVLSSGFQVLDCALSHPTCPADTASQALRRVLAAMDNLTHASSGTYSIALQESWCNVLGKVVPALSDPDTVTRVVDKLFAVMGAFPGKPVVLFAACSALAKVVRSSTHREHMHVGIPVIYGVITSASSSPKVWKDVVGGACSVLQSFPAQQIVTADLITTLQAWLPSVADRAQLSDAVAPLAAIVHLLGVVANADSSRLHVPLPDGTELNVISFLVTVINRFGSQTELLMAALLVLCRISKSPEGGVAVVQTVGQKAFSAVNYAMDKNTDSAKLQIVSCCVLNNLVANQREIPTSWIQSAITRVVRAAERFADDPDIQRPCCNFLLAASRSESSELGAIILENPAVITLMKASASFRDDIDLQVTVFSALRQLAKHKASRTTLATLLSEEDWQVIAEVVKGHWHLDLDDPACLRLVLTVLELCQVLTSLGSVCHATTVSGLYPLFLDISRRYMGISESHARIQAVLCTILHKLCSSSSSREFCRAPGRVEQLVDLLVDVMTAFKPPATSGAEVQTAVSFALVGLLDVPGVVDQLKRRKVGSLALNVQKVIKPRCDARTLANLDTLIQNLK